MTPAADIKSASEPSSKGETFFGVVWRRLRYAVAVILSAVIFNWLGWWAAAPPAEWGGVSLAVWPAHFGLGAVVLMAILLLTTAICSLIVHPDSPHMGLFCALLGMAALSIRGGTAHMLMVYGEGGGGARMPEVAMRLAVECVAWGVVILLADAFARKFHDRLLKNHHWVMRSNPAAGKELLIKSRVGSAMGFSKAVSEGLRTNRIKGPVRIPLAMIASGACAFLFLGVFMQSELKGQVLMACFLSFFLSTVCAYAAFPSAPFWALILAVPLTGATAYLIGRDALPQYPGHAGFFAMRALPIDYLTAGVAGAILGLYKGFEWSVGSAEDL